MQMPATGSKKDAFSWLSKRRKIPKDIRQLIDAICIVDAARVGRFKRLKELGKFVEDGDLAKGTGFSWKAVRGDISTILDLPKKDPTIARYASLIPALSIMILSGFMVIVLLFTLRIYWLFDVRKYTSLEFSNVIAIVLFVIGGLLVARWYMDERIGEFYETNPTKSQRLGRFTQALIDHLVQKLKHSKKPVDFQMRLYNVDYKGISVRKKPSLIRDYYVIKIDLKKN